MTTAPQTLVDLQAKLVANLGTTNLGIVGDASHIATGGYHIGAASLRQHGMSNDYSLVFAADRNSTSDFACAIDIGGAPALLMALGTRLVAALRSHDPRVYHYVRGVNAPFDNIATDRRYDCEDPNNLADDNVQASSDRNHVHIEIYRTLVLSQSVMDGLYEVLAGVGHAPDSPPPVPVPPKPAQKAWQGYPVPSMIAQGTHNYFGDIDGNAHSLGGAHGDANDRSSERGLVKVLQQRLIACGFVPGVTDVNSGWADGIFNAKDGHIGGPTSDAVVRFQRAHMPGTTFFGQCWYDDWSKLFNL